MKTFNPFRLPKVMQTASKIAVNENDFGDGYSHCIASGINTKSDELTLSWEGLTFAEAKSLTDFFKAQDAESFFFTDPTTNVTNMYRCIEWHSTAAERHISLEVIFKQTFN